MLAIRLPSTLHRSWWAAVLGVAFALMSAALVYYFLVRKPVEPAWPELSAATRRANLETCSEGAHLFHDVRWAAVCMAMAEQDASRDGSADCELPDATSARLYELLRAAENRCFAEARATRVVP